MKKIAWRGKTKAWGRSRKPDLKIPYPDHEATVVIVTEPKEETFGADDIRFRVTVGYLGGKNAQVAMYDRKESKKYTVEPEIGGLYTVWLATSLTQALVNLYPEEDASLVGKVIRMWRETIEGGRFGAFLGYRAENVEDYSTELVDRIFDSLEEGEGEELDEEEEVEAGTADLEIAYQLVETSLKSLGSMTFAQIGNFLKSRKESGLMRTTLSAEEVANFCVSKNPDSFEIERDGDTRSLVQK